MVRLIEMVSYGREMVSYGREMRVILGDICDERTKYQSTILYRGAPTKIIHALDSWRIYCSLHIYHIVLCTNTYVYSHIKPTRGLLFQWDSTFYTDISCLAGVFAENTSLETPSPFGSGNFSSLDWYFSYIPLPNIIYLFNYTEYYLEHQLDK